MGHMTTCPMKGTCPTRNQHLLCMLRSAILGIRALTVSCLIHGLVGIESLLDTQGIADLFHIGRWPVTQQRSVQAMMLHYKRGKHGLMLHPWSSYLSS